MTSQKAAAFSALLQQKDCQSIYLSLEANNFHQAIQHADQLINSGSSSQVLARALKALALYHTRDEAKAVKEVEAVLASINVAVTDQSVLSPLAFVLGRTGRRAKAADILDAASKGRPGDLDINLKAFEALLAIPDYLRAQQLATRMHKAFGGPVDLAQSKRNGNQSVVGNPQCSSARNRYFWWSMQAYIMLALETPQSQGAGLALVLAERMIQKHVSTEEGRFDEQSHEDLHLYISVLLAQAEGLSQEGQSKKWKEALQLLQTDPGSHIAERSLGLGQLKLDLLHRTGDWPSLEMEARRLIEGGDRNWMTIEKWIEGVGGLGKKDAEALQKAIEMADSLVAKNGKRRDYPLLRLALHHELRKNSTSGTSDNFVSLIESYFKTFSCKLCCYEDLQPFLDALEPQESARLLACESILTLDPTQSADKPTYSTEDDVIKALNAAKVRARVGSHSPSKTEHVSKTIERLLLAFYVSLPISAKVPKTVPRAGADFVLIAAQLVLAISQSASVLIHLAAILTHAANASPASYALKVLCMRIYFMLGCSKEARKLWVDLKIRGIQNESLGWLWIGPRQDGVIRDESAPVQEWKWEASKLYREVENDRTKLVMAAFERGNYSSVREFAEFTRRIERSTQRQLVDLDTARMELQLMKNWEARSEKVTEVLEKAGKIVKEGLLQQWDDAILPSFCSKQMPSLVAATSREHRLDYDHNALLIQRQRQYISLLGRPNPALFATTGGPEVSSGKEGAATEDLEALAARIVEELHSGPTDRVEEWIQALLERTTNGEQARLLWQELCSACLVLDLYLLFWHLESAASAPVDEAGEPDQSAETASTEPTVSRLLKRCLHHLRQALESVQVGLKQARALALHDEASEVDQSDGTMEEKDDGKSTPAERVEPLTRTLERILDSQKGGKGTREKVFKDIKDGAARTRRCAAERVQEVLGEFA